MTDSITILLLDETPINGYDSRVSCELSMPDKSLSGNSSSTAVSEEGFKPKRLSAQLKVRFADAEDLRKLIVLSETLADSGERKIYTIINQTAKAFNVRQVRFTEKIKAAELEDQQAWQVNFVLLEHNSVPEKVEKRQEKTQSNSQSEALPNGALAEIEPEEQEQMGWVESIIAKQEARLQSEAEASETTT